MDLAPILTIVVSLVVAWIAMLAIFWAFRPRGVAVRELVGVVPDLLRLLRTLVADPATPLDVRVVLVALAAWIISPIDLIPEFIPVLGPLDDIVVGVVALRYVRRRVGVHVIRSRWPGTDAGLAVLLRVIGGGDRG